MLQLEHLSGTLTIDRFPMETPLASLLPPSSGSVATDFFFSITQTREEISVVRSSSPLQHSIQPPQKSEPAWDYFRVQGTLDFGLTGIVSRLTAPLARHEISVFVISTFDTDYILIKSDKATEAVRIWNDLEGVSVLSSSKEG